MATLQYKDPTRAPEVLQPRRVILGEVEFVSDSSDRLPTAEVTGQAKIDKLLKIDGVSEVKIDGVSEVKIDGVSEVKAKVKAADIPAP